MKQRKGGSVGQSGSVTGTIGPGGGARFQVRYNMHLPVLYLWDEGKSCTLLEKVVFPTFQGYFICNNWHMCRLLWEDWELKILHVPTSLYAAETMYSLLKIAQGGQKLRMQPSGFRLTSPLKPPFCINLISKGECIRQKGVAEKRNLTVIKTFTP